MEQGTKKENRLLKIIKQDRVKKVIFNSILFIVGVLLCFLRGTAINVLERIMSTALIVYGIYCIIKFCVINVDSRSSTLFIEGIIWVITGTILDIFPALFVFGFGWIILLQGVKFVMKTRALKPVKNLGWYIEFIYNCVLIILGALCVILSNTEVATNIVSILLGVSLIIFGVSNIIMEYTLDGTFVKVKSSGETKDNNSNSSNDDFTDYTIS